VELGLGKQGQVTPFWQFGFLLNNHFSWLLCAGQGPKPSTPRPSGAATACPSQGQFKRAPCMVREVVEDHPLVAAVAGQPWKLPVSSSPVTRSWMPVITPCGQRARERAWAAVGECRG
jgi:hypothetical protein